MATEKYNAGSGQGLTWGNAFSATTLNGLAVQDAILSDIAIDNSTALDLYADVSLIFSTSITWAADAPFAWLFLYPLNQDGSTYGDGRFTSATASQPGRQYFCGSFSFIQGSGTQVDTLTAILLPPGKFKFVMWNGSPSGGSAFPSSNCNCYYRTYNRVVA